MVDKLDDSLDEINAELQEPIPEPSEEESPKPKRGVKKVAKAKKTAAKKVSKKSAAPASKKKESDGSIKLKDLATEAGITEQRARQKLREAEVERNGRWSWEDGSSALKAARKALGL